MYGPRPFFGYGESLLSVTCSPDLTRAAGAAFTIPVMLRTATTLMATGGITAAAAVPAILSLAIAIAILGTETSRVLTLVFTPSAPSNAIADALALLDKMSPPTDAIEAALAGLGIGTPAQIREIASLLRNRETRMLGLTQLMKLLQDVACPQLKKLEDGAWKQFRAAEAERVSGFSREHRDFVNHQLELHEKHSNIA